MMYYSVMSNVLFFIFICFSFYVLVQSLWYICFESQIPGYWISAGGLCSAVHEISILIYLYSYFYGYLSIFTA